MNRLNDDELEMKLRELFESNYEYLKENSGHAINETMKERAFDQVLMYWKKHREMLVGGKVSSIKISVPNQKSPSNGIPFSIEGKINVLEKDGKKTLFDVTTNSAEQIEDDIEFYQDELNLYARELEKMQYGQIDETAVLSTSIPRDVRHALRSDDALELNRALENWNPFVSVAHGNEAQEKALEKVGEVVDKINDCKFDPPSPDELNGRYMDGKTFYVHVCENCDIRKSCESYLQYHDLFPCRKQQ